MSSFDKLADMCCEDGAASLATDDIARLMAELGHDWKISEDRKSLQKRYVIKGFAKAVYLANLASYVADSQNHHPDISFGWGYCGISFTTHSAGGLTLNDFICAARIERATG